MESNRTYQQDRWTRSQDRWIAGVSGGIAKNLGVETWVIRLIWILTIFCGLGPLAYIALAISLPMEGFVHEGYQPKLLGVCHEISLRTHIEVGIVRFISVLLGVSSLGTFLIGYLVLYFVFNSQSRNQKNSFGKYSF